MKLDFVVRPTVYCALCGSVVEQKQHTPTRREVWCAEPGCVQKDMHIIVNDPCVFGVRAVNDDH